MQPEKFEGLLGEICSQHVRIHCKSSSMLHTVMQRVQDPLFELIISNTDNLVGAMYVAETKTVCAG
jgi:hypothetical protein